MAEAQVFGLTGGMGSGKSTVSLGFVERGATLVDADQIVHDLQQPGSAVLGHMTTLLGDDILEPTGELNRRRAAEHIFGNDEKRIAVQDMIGPFLWQRIYEGIAQAEPDQPVILDVPLLFDTGTPKVELQGVIVVDTPIELAVERLMAKRGFSKDEAYARIGKQLTREARLQHADYVIINDSTPEALNQQISDAWRWMHSL